MTRILQAVALVSMLIVTVLVTGCGKSREAADAGRNVGAATQLQRTGKATFQTPQGEVQVESQPEGGKEEATTTIKLPDGQTTVAKTGKTIDEKALGLAVYPGATADDSVSVSNPSGGSVTARLTTTDSFDKVANFYKSKYPQASVQAIDGPDGKALTMQLGGGHELKMILITQKDGKVEVLLQSHAQAQ